MKFYNRENELAELQRIQELSFEENSHDSSYRKEKNR